MRKSYKSDPSNRKLYVPCHSKIILRSNITGDYRQNDWPFITSIRPKNTSFDSICKYSTFFTANENVVPLLKKLEFREERVKAVITTRVENNSTELKAQTINIII